MERAGCYVLASASCDLEGRKIHPKRGEWVGHGWLHGLDAFGVGW